MWKALITACVLSVFAAASTANACSCFCMGGEKLSEYFDSNKMFWGIPLSHDFEKTTYTSGEHSYININVRTQVKIVEGYGQFPDQQEIEIVSPESDGVSCGHQYKLNELQLITTYGPDHGVSTCNCRPPLPLAEAYLTRGKDLYMPTTRECQSGDKRRDSLKRKCRIVSASWSREAEDRDDVMARLQGRLPANASKP